jgi:hypothetical protein
VAKLSQATGPICCATCGAYQCPGGQDAGQCYDPRHECKKAKQVRETNVCCYWHERGIQLDKPASLTDRIFAALYFSNGGAPRGTREICDWIGLEYGTTALCCDVARLLEHSYVLGRVIQREPRASPMECKTWVGRYQRILNSDEEGTVRFELAPDTRARFAERFASYCADFGKRGAA